MQEKEALSSRGWGRLLKCSDFTNSIQTSRNTTFSMCSHVLITSVFSGSMVVFGPCKCQPLSHVQLFATPQTAAHQAPLSMGFSRQEHWSGLPFSPPRDLSDPGIKPTSFISPALAGRLFTTRATMYLLGQIKIQAELCFWSSQPHMASARENTQDPSVIAR